MVWLVHSLNFLKTFIFTLLVQALKHTGDPTRNLSTNLVPCDIEDSEYVLVSINNGSTVSGKTQDAPRNVVSRSKSTPFQNTIQSSLSILSRSNSGPMVKNNKDSLVVNASSSNRFVLNAS